MKIKDSYQHQHEIPMPHQKSPSAFDYEWSSQSDKVDGKRVYFGVMQWLTQ
jgi:hypothetical protein